ncbi:Diaminopimelate epimerase [Prochlorococcus marinus str. SS2]|nr:Diaminopimelate epimerase [Prochlorococcus marinus str. SS2]KGG23537.1 Diaminopimelate epimerase [Prochlorococcus marinus str. SS35]
MQIFNSDGSIAEMCGNGIRCLIKYLYNESQLNEDINFIIETLAGNLDCYVLNGDHIRVNMGSPSFEPKAIPTTLSPNNLNIPEGTVTIKNENITMYGIGMGNPHMVIILKSIEDLQLEELGRNFETDNRFPNKTNVHFVEVLNMNKILVKVWERGCGATLACGTGACACLAVTSLLGLTNNKSEVVLPGGSLFIDWLNTSDPLYMTGPAEFVFSGQLYI